MTPPEIIAPATKSIIIRYKKTFRFLTFLAIFIVLLFLGYKVLSEGVRIKHFSIAKISVDELFFKLEDKFILDIQRIDFSHSSLFAKQEKTEPSALPSIELIGNVVKNVVIVLSYFKELHIHELITPVSESSADSDQNFENLNSEKQDFENAQTITRSILYDGKLFEIYDPNIAIVFGTQTTAGRILLQLQSLEIKEFGVEIDGFLEYHTARRFMNFNLTANMPQNAQSAPSLIVRGSTDFDNFNISLNAPKYTSIAFLRPYIALLHNPTLEAWLFENISFESFELTSLNVKASFNNIERDIKRNLMASAVITNALINPNPSVIKEPIKVKTAILNLKNGVLDISLQQPRFSNYDLEGSSVRVFLPFERSVGVEVAVRTPKAELKKELLNLLEGFDIHLPIATKSGFVSANIDIQVKEIDKKMTPIVSGKIAGKGVKLLFLDEEFLLDDVEAKIDIGSKNKVVSAKSNNASYRKMLNTSAELLIDIANKRLDSEFNLKNAEVSLDNFQEKSAVLPPYLDESKAKDPMTKSIIRAILADNESNLPQLFVYKNSQTLPLHLSGTFGDELDLELSEFGLQIKSDASALNISLASIAEVAKYSPLLKYFDVTSGTASLSKAANSSAVYFNASLENLRYPLYKNGNLVSKINASGHFNNGEIYARTPNKDIEISKKENTLHIVAREYDLSVDDIFASKVPMIKQAISESDEMLEQVDSVDSQNVVDSEKALDSQNVVNSEKAVQNIAQMFQNLDEQNLGASGTNGDNKEITALDSQNSESNKVADSENSLDSQNLLDSENAPKTNAPKTQKRVFTKEDLRREALFIQQKRKYERDHKIPPHITQLEASKVNISFGNFKIPADELSLTLRDRRVDAGGQYGNGIAHARIAHGITDIDMSYFNTDFINKAMGKQILSGGIFDMKGVMVDGVLQGELKLQNTNFMDLLLVQNIVALIDALPSLIVFKKPGLSNKGYEIKKGRVLFSLNNENLGLEEIDLVGTAIDVKGGGLVKLSDNTLNVLLEASTMKTFSDILSSIPIVGFLILGDDGRITTNIVVSGDLSNPKTEVSLLEDVITAPFRILRRVFRPVEWAIDSFSSQ